MVEKSSAIEQYQVGEEVITALRKKATEGVCTDERRLAES